MYMSDPFHRVTSSWPTYPTSESTNLPAQLAWHAATTIIHHDLAACITRHSKPRYDSGAPFVEKTLIKEALLWIFLSSPGARVRVSVRPIGVRRIRCRHQYHVGFGFVIF